MSKMDDVVELLKKHYLENVLPPEPNPGYEELKERLRKDDGGLLAEGLSKMKDSRTTVLRSDIEGAEILEPKMQGYKKRWGIEPPRAICIMLPEDRYSVLTEKGVLNKNSAGAAMDGHAFEEGSPFYGMNVMLLTANYTDYESEHEHLHCSYAELSAPLKHFLKKMEDETDELKRLEFAHLANEFEVMSELFAYRLSLKIKQISYPKLSKLLRSWYVENWLDRYFDSVKLPDGGIVSRHSSEALVGAGMKSDLEEKVKDAVGSLWVLNTNLSASEVTKIMLSCGSTTGELERSMGPIDEFDLWSRNHQEVLGVDEF